MCYNNMELILMDIYYFTLIKNVLLFTLLGVTIYYTHNPWVLFGLIFTSSVTHVSEHIKTECPKCGCEFTAVEKEDD